MPVEIAACVLPCPTEVLGPIHETKIHELRVTPVRRENGAMPQSYPSKTSTHKKSTFLISRTRPP